jgi:predicted RecB family nuclease
MDINQIDAKPNVIRALQSANYTTVDKLATADPNRLAALPGIGLATAKKLIAQAREIVNRERLAESQFIDGSTGPAAEPTVIMSARLKLIQLANGGIG